MSETKKELITKINHLYNVVCGLLGGIVGIYISLHGGAFLLGFFMGGFVGWVFQPYNKKGELRY